MGNITDHSKNHHPFELLGREVHIVDKQQFQEVIASKYTPAKNDFILCDTNTAKHCLPVYREFVPILDERQVIIIEAGEEEKNIHSLHHIWSSLQHAGADKESRLFNLGGGVITDIGGFAASTFKRGIEFVHIPTTLIGMADASIGGKNAINLGKTKNQAGNFALPLAVIIYPGFLETLDWKEYQSGFAEIVKIALAFDRRFWHRIQDTGITETSRDQITSFLKDKWLNKACLLKASVVEHDFKDKGKRQCLNFGHTVAHGLEALYLNQGKILQHGLAVAAGMICEAEIATHLTGLKTSDADRIRYYIMENFPKVGFAEHDIENIISFIRQDKKNKKGHITMSLLESPGACKYGISCHEDLIRYTLASYHQLS